ncbi:nucleotidyltransferase domain-containing protein [bacterium]|nr:nucleotidyltransferase domain-containing protein [bacterium]
MSVNEIFEVLRNEKNKAREKYKAEIKGFFGSYAKGEADSKSDVDILVAFDESADLFDLVGLAIFLEEKVEQKVDIVPESDIRKELREQILKEAIWI